MKVPDKLKAERLKWLMKLAPLISFAIPFMILYYYYPSSFEMTWKGRTYYLFFLWLAALETIMLWEELKADKWSSKPRAFLFIVACALPTLYVVVSQCFLDSAIIELSFKSHIGENTLDKMFFVNLMPLSIEYLAFTILFALIVAVEYGVQDLQKYSISTFFLGTIGMIYVIDNLYPYGRFAPFQFLVPTTANLAASVLKQMGYSVRMAMMNNAMYGYVPLLQAGKFSAVIAWPCSGIDSLIIYTITILLFLKKTDIPLSHRVIYFIVGAMVTYLINVLRIVTIVIIGINTGEFSTDFHNYYGPLYSLSWIIAYPLIISGSRALWGKIKTPKN
ncbi:MAG: archaeosortase/exosortase family protein [Candidatus Bathyarchaeia archaeon]